MTRSFLIVDPERNTGEALAIALRLEGFLATIALTAEQGRARLHERRFDVCLVDARIDEAADLLGEAAARGVRAVAVGRHPEMLVATSARVPNVATLLKPFLAVDLLVLLEEILGAAC